jgi:hypothetical protein
MCRHRLLALLFALGWGATFVWAAEPWEKVDHRLPASSWVIDVTQAPYNARGDGKTDNTATLQKLLNDHVGQHKIFYFPNGTYLISGSLKLSNRSSAGRNAYGFNWFQGQSAAGTILKLKDGTFTDKAKIQPILWGGGFGSADWFHNYVQDITFDIGKNNAGSTGLQFYSNNTGAVRRCVFVSGDGQGAVGLDLGHRDMNGPLLVRQVRVEGFRTGIAASRSVNSQTLEDVHLSGQKEFGIDNHGQALSIRGLRCTNAVIALRTYGTVWLMDSTLTGTGDARNAPAIVNYNGGRIGLRDVTTVGYKRALADLATPDWVAAFRVTGEDKPGSLGPKVAEYFSQKPTSPFGGKAQSLRLPIEETPETLWTDPKAWAIAEKFGADPTGKKDSAEAIQKAIDSGSETVFLPGFYQVSKPIVVRGAVRRIVGSGGWIDYNGKTKPNLRIADGKSKQVSIEHFSDMGGGIEVATDRSVILRSLGTKRLTFTKQGHVYLEDVVTDDVRLSKGHRVWARQLNIENEGTHLRNEGADLWVLGYKTERGGTLLHTLGGGRSEIFGTFSYTTTAGKLAPMFVTEEASVFAYFAEVCYTGDPFTVWIREKRGDETKTLNRGEGTLSPYIGTTDK